MTAEGWPRIERTATGRPVWNVGPEGYLSVALPPLPATWPGDWPNVDVLGPEQAGRLLAERRRRAYRTTYDEASVVDPWPS